MNGKIKKDKGQITVYVVFFIIFILFSIYCLYPLFFCFANSLKTMEEFFEAGGGYFTLPDKWRLGNYLDIFDLFAVNGYGFWEMTWNSIWLAFGSQFLNIAARVLVAYPLARYKFPLKNFFYGIIIFRITVPIIGSGAAGYKFMRTLNMIDNPMLYMLNFINGFDMTALILYGYFKGISKEYSEAAFLDGASKLQVLFNVVLPQALPCIIALYISHVMGRWNDYSTPMIYLRSYPNLAYGIYLFDTSAMFVPNGKAMFFGAVMLSALVPLGLFSAGQKIMLTNMSVGGLKG